MRIRPEVLQMWGVGGMQVHEIHGDSVVYKEVIEALLNYKKSYFWWFWNLACGDSTRSSRTDKDQAQAPPKSVWGKRGEGSVCKSCNGGYVDILFTCGECVAGCNCKGLLSFTGRTKCPYLLILILGSFCEKPIMGEIEGLILLLQ